MPAGQPFTKLCQQMHRPTTTGRADLHLHTTCSDGAYTPAQLVDLARRSGLAAIAVTDHDTLDGVEPARLAARGSLDVIAGVEMTTHWLGHELHLLAYFVRLDDPALNLALDQIRHGRVERFQEMRERLRGLGVQLEMATPNSTSLGRRHLAEMLVQAKHAATIRQAFQRFLGDGGRVTVPKRCPSVEEAIRLVGGAGGVTAWAHPSYDGGRDNLTRLRDLGLQAVEANFPSCRPGRGKELRAVAHDLGLAVTGGSDCHGPDQPGRAVGACSISAEELAALRALAKEP